MFFLPTIMHHWTSKQSSLEFIELLAAYKGEWKFWLCAVLPNTGFVQEVIG